MTKKKKPKRGLSGKGGSASPSSSASSQCSGASKQVSSKAPASSSPIKLDLAASIVDGSVDLPVPDLQLESRATVQTSIDAIEPAAKEVSSTPSAPTKAQDSGPQDTSVPSAPATSVANPEPETQADLPTLPSAPATIVANPELETQVDLPIINPLAEKATTAAAVAPATLPANKSNDEWVGLFKAKGKKLEKKGTPFTLPSGEKCINIPNTVIEKNKKSWEAFVIGQFYSDPPPQKLIHNIVNGIWSKQYKDITVSKLEGNAFLFRIPNAATRNRVIYQRLWQIEGQTMFVANWEPGNLPEKPALTSAPIWLELRNVPLQFFNEDGLERIAGLVGHPKYLHPATANKTILDVAKVLTIIDPRMPLPEAVNVQFDSGDICRVTVSSPWMPPVCSHCREIGHSIKRCPSAPITCTNCKSTSHSTESCTRAKSQETKKPKKTRRSRSRQKANNPPQNSIAPPHLPNHRDTPAGHLVESVKGKGIAPPADTNSAIARTSPHLANASLRANEAESSKVNDQMPVSEVESDSSDIPTSDSDVEEGQYIPVKTRHKARFGRDRGPKTN